MLTNEEATYEFVGKIGEVAKQTGNAVPVNTSAVLVMANLGPARGRFSL